MFVLSGWNETILHVFHSCNLTPLFSHNFNHFLNQIWYFLICYKRLPYIWLSWESNCHSFVLFNHLLLLFKLNVYNSRNDTVLCLNKLLRDITEVKNIEKIETCQSQMKVTQYLRKWLKLTLFQQICSYFDNIFLKASAILDRGSLASYFLDWKMKKATDDGKTFAALLTDLLKALDCLPHDHIIAKLNVLKFIKINNLSHRKHRSRINRSHNTYEEILLAFPHCSIFGPILFDTFMSALFSVSRNDDNNMLMDICHCKKF